MTTPPESWFAVSQPGSSILTCCSCRETIDLGFPSLDHHAGYCPRCGIESIFVSWNDTLVQIALPKAPPELLRLLRWMQENLDELEFVALLTHLDEMAEFVQAKAAQSSPT